VAAPIWARFMRQAMSGKPAEDFFSAPKPDYEPFGFDLPDGSAYLNPENDLGN